ncbi:MAG: COX15/CtaA family protein [Chitinophagaceae bacterium]
MLPVTIAGLLLQINITMQESRSFILFSKIILVTVFLVILAGGVVRMTQSGMGCPDWPKCFGRWIPPMNESELPENYKELYKFKYIDTSFNPYHTWIEYINRLLGALLGVLLLIQFTWSLKFRKTRPRITLLSFALLLVTGFQGWLGSKVVEGNLEVAKVTAHMLVAILIAAVSYRIIYESRIVREKVLYKNLRPWVIVTIILLLIQIILGTQVREEIDHISLDLNFTSRQLWISRLSNIFLIHRTFSIIVASTCIFLFIKYREDKLLGNTLKLVAFCIFAIVILGIVMNYFSMPAIAQPLHLLFSTILITGIYAVFCKTMPAKNSIDP